MTSARRVCFNMGEFGHSSRKPTVLVGTAPWLDGFCPPASSSTAAASTDHGPAKPKAKAKSRSKVAQPAQLTKRRVENGRLKVWGTKALKGSQVYPVRFALRVAQLQWPDVFQQTG